MSNNEHDPVASLIAKGTIAVVGGPDGPATAKLLADRAQSGVLIQPRDVSGLKPFQMPTGADLAWNKAVTTIILIPESWSPNDVRAAFALADAAIYAEGGYLYVVKSPSGGNPMPIKVEELTQ